MDILMSGRERDRLVEMRRLAEGQITQRQAAERLGLSVRHVRRTFGRWRACGDAGLVHRLRGRRSNRGLDEATERRVAHLLLTELRDFGPTLASEHLLRDHGIGLSREGVRRRMHSLGLFGARRRPRPHRTRRPRRPCFGELVQMDTSEHAWLEGRGPTLFLITMIDDATGFKLLGLFEADTVEANFEMIRRWIERFGRPQALYTDQASHFRQPGTQTQIERALGQLGIRLITARSPQAKGRVERSHRTDQDRLVKQMRLAKVTTLEGANRFVQTFYLDEVNRLFAKAPADAQDAHRSAEGYDLAAILCPHETRTVANDHCVSIAGVAWQIEPAEITRGLRGAKVTVEHRLDGGMRLRWKDRYLAFRRAGEMGTTRRPASRPPRCPQFPSPCDGGRGETENRTPRGHFYCAQEEDISTVR